MGELISICIPTYERRRLLLEAIQSCIEQKYRPLEIVIGDDSISDDTHNGIAAFAPPPGIELVYFHHSPSLGQSGNVNKLLDAARGSKLCLLHDDDLLMPDAIVKLAGCWEEAPELAAAYGKQYIISESGKIDLVASEKLNATYQRTSSHRGRQNTPVIAGLLQQFPNNGYLVVTELARRIRYRDRREVGDGCDHDFGIRLGLESSAFYFLDEYICKYRITSNAVSTRSPQFAGSMFPTIEETEVPEDALETKQWVLQEMAAGAIKDNAAVGNRKAALRIYFSDHFPIKKRLSPKGIYLALCILINFLARWHRPVR